MMSSFNFWTLTGRKHKEPGNALWPSQAGRNYALCVASVMVGITSEARSGTGASG